MRGYAGSSLFHTGIGDPQKRLRLIDQSRALASHLPKLPSLTCSGTHRICWLSSPIRSRSRVTSTNHDEIARYTRGWSHRQQCGYEWLYESWRTTTPRCLGARISFGLATNTFSPAQSGTSAVYRPCSSIGQIVGMPTALLAIWSSSP